MGPISPSQVQKISASICVECGTAVEAQIYIQDGKVFQRKTCPDHGTQEALIYGDAALYQSITKFKRPGKQPKGFATQESLGCPLDCGFCPKHQQHLCLAIIEVNEACNLDCPLCLADAGTHLIQSGFELSFEQVEFMLDRFIEMEEHPEVLQFSGGEPCLHPQILDFIQLAKDKGIDYVLLNTNGIRIANDDDFLAEIARLQPHVYLQFDGLDPSTYQTLRGRADLVTTKVRALDRLAEADVRAILVPAIEYDVNLHEVGAIVQFGLSHPAVFGVSFHSAFRAQRHPAADPLTRITTPDILHALEEQTDGLFRLDDFIPVPCCNPTCGFSTYAILTEDNVVPLPRLLDVEHYLTYVENRTMPALEKELISKLEALWSMAATPGMESATELIQQFAGAQEIGQRGKHQDGPGCSACRSGLSLSQHKPRDIARHVFMISTRDFMDPWTFNTEDLLKCCIGVLTPDGRAIPFCAYNTAGYREEVRQALRQQSGRRVMASAD